jgi:hypothetical protein
VSLDPYVVIDYIKSSVDIILNLKFEEIEKRLIDKGGNDNSSDGQPKRARTESQANHDVVGDTLRSHHMPESSTRSSMSH